MVEISIPTQDMNVAIRFPRDSCAKVARMGSAFSECSEVILTSCSCCLNRLL